MHPIFPQKPPFAIIQLLITRKGHISKDLLIQPDKKVAWLIVPNNVRFVSYRRIDQILTLVNFKNRGILEMNWCSKDKHQILRHLTCRNSCRPLG